MPELQVPKKPSFLLHSTAKGWQRVDLLMANIETKGYLFPRSLIKHYGGPVCAECSAAPYLKEHSRSSKRSSRGEGHSSLHALSSCPPQGLGSCCSHHLDCQPLLLSSSVLA